MTDALRSERSSPGDPPDRERDARIEELLLAGLDHYFAGHYDLAINVWTRVLFLDRGHGKARAYIERARGAVAERQREADELLHTGAAALARGDRAAARQLLTSAADRGPGGEEALALLHRLDRLDAAHLPSHRQARRLAPARDPGGDLPPVNRRDPRLGWVAAGIAAGILIAVVAGGYLWIVSGPFDVDAPHTALPPLVEAPLPVPAACELRLARARDLFKQGRLHAALRELEPGDPDQQHRAGYDELRAAVQRQLLDTGRQNAGFPYAGERGGLRSSRPSRAPQRK